MYFCHVSLQEGTVDGLFEIARPTTVLDGAKTRRKLTGFAPSIWWVSAGFLHGGGSLENKIPRKAVEEKAPKHRFPDLMNGLVVVFLKDVCVFFVEIPES